MKKILIAAGIILVLTGLLWPYLGKIPLGKLPGDIFIDKPNFKIYIPITTMILISLLLTLILWIIQKIK